MPPPPRNRQKRPLHHRRRSRTLDTLARKPRTLREKPPLLRPRHHPRAANNADEWFSNLQQWLACEQLIEFIGALSRLAFCEHRTGDVTLLRIILLRNQYHIVQYGKDIAERLHNDRLSPEQFQNFFLDHMWYCSGSSLAALAYGKVTNYRPLTPELRHQCLKAQTLDDVRALLKKPEKTNSSETMQPSQNNPTA